MTPGLSIDKTSLLLKVLIFFFVSAFYLVTLSNGFVYDDNFVVMDNMLIRGTTPVSEYFFNNVWSFFSEDSKANFYRPLQLLLYRVEYGVFGLTPWPWHLASVLLHALNAALVFSLSLKLLPKIKSSAFGGDLTGRSLVPFTTLLPPLLTALIFALHPVNVEPVSWVSSVSDLLFVFFFLISFLFFIKSKGEGAGTLRAYVLSLGFFLLALFSKETAMAFIPVIFIYAVFFTDFKLRGTVKTLIPFVIVAFFYLIIRTYALGGLTQKEVTELSGFVAILNILPLFFAYISKLLFPLNLSVIYEIDVATSLFDLSVVAGFLLLSLFIFLFYCFRKTRVIPFSLVLILIPLIPILYIPAVSTGGFAERYLYLSTFGLALFIAYLFMRGLEEVAIRHKERGASFTRLLNGFIILFVLSVLVFFSVSSIARMRIWKDDLSLWLSAVEMSPKSSIAHYNAGTVYVKEHKYAEALWHFQNAARLDPSYKVAFFNIGSIMARSRRYGDAVYYYKRAIGEGSNIDEFYIDMARAYMFGGKAGEAIEVLEGLVKRKPDLKEAKEMLKEARSRQ